MSRVGAVIVALALTACFGPSYPQGLPCSERATCPPSQTCGLDGVCQGSSVAPGSRCGDGEIDSAEACDDGDTVDTGNGCSSDCQKNAVCGDGVVQALYEACEPVGLAACSPDCAAVPGFVVGGQVRGLAGGGLVLDGGELLPIASDGAFVFPSRRSPGDGYQVTVATQPTSPWQRCDVAGGAGVIEHDVDGITVDCATERFPVGGTVVGLAPLNTLRVVLAVDGDGDGGDDGQPQGIELVGDGAFRFTAPIASGRHYRVSAEAGASFPVPQQCAVEHGEGAMAGAAVSDVVLRCGPARFRLGGTVTGLDGRVVLRDAGGGSAKLTADGAFTFPNTVPFGYHYAVGVVSHPLGQRCHVLGGDGVIGGDVTSIAVICGACGDDLVPAMTSATSPSGRVSASGEFPGDFDAWHAFDDGNSMWISAANAAETWIRYQWSDGPRWVARYGIHFVNGSSKITRAPRDFSLWGLRGPEQVELDRRSGVVFDGDQLRVFDLAQPGGYDGYELRVTDDNDPAPGIVVISIGSLLLTGEACDSGPPP